MVGSRRAAATKALSSGNDNHQRPPSPSRNTHFSDRGCSNGGATLPLPPPPPPAAAIGAPRYGRIPTAVVVCALFASHRLTSAARRRCGLR